jgi:hypothetical protein
VISLDCKVINKIFELTLERTTILATKPYNDELGKGCEGNKEDHYLQNYSYVILKPTNS